MGNWLKKGLANADNLLVGILKTATYNIQIEYRVGK
jgi:hypothetical protein